MCRSLAELDVADGIAVGVSHGRQVLPTNVAPRHYHVTLEPDFENLTFAGVVVIDLDVRQDTNSISLNTLEIDIHQTVISSGEKIIRHVFKLYG